MLIDIQSKGFELSAAIEDHARRRLQFALGWAHQSVRKVAVRLSDENGPRGGRDKRCHLVLGLEALPDLVIEDIQDDLYVAIDSAADRLGRSLARRLQRQRQAMRARAALEER